MTRFPLPGLLVALLALAFAHGPLIATPPLFDEAPFLQGVSVSRGAVLGMRWLPAELALFGGEPRAHRIFALLLEMALLAVVAAVLSSRRSRAPNLALLAVAAYLVHPWRTESFVRLGSRPVIVSEVLLIAGFLLVGAVGRWKLVAPGLLFLAAGASGMPGAVMFGLPAAATDRVGARRHGLAVAGALLAGLAVWWIAAPAAADSRTALAGLDRLARPWATGLIHLGAPWSAAYAGASILGLLLLIAWVRHARVAAVAVAAAALALALSPSLRPPRTGLEFLGEGLTPEAWLPALALLLYATWRLADGAGWTLVPLLALVGLSIGSGIQHARRFSDESKLLAHSIAVEPDAVDIRILQADLLLNAVTMAPPEQQRDFATAAMQSAERALLRRPDDVGAGSLKSLALALMGRPREARELSDHLLRQAPNDWRARAGRAELEAVAGDDFEALRWLRPAVESNPTPYLRARQTALIERIYQQVRVELADHQWATARRSCERLIEIAPEEIEARTTRVDTFMLEGDLPRALEECRKLYGERPHDRAIVQRMASLYERLGQTAEALEFKRILLSLPPK